MQLAMHAWHAARINYQFLSPRWGNWYNNPKKQNKTKQNKPIKQQNRKVIKVIIIYLLIGNPL